MPARSVCLVALSLSEAGPGRCGGQVSVTDIYHTIPYHHTFYFVWKKEKKLRNEEEFDQPVFFSSIRFPERKIKHMGWEYLFTTV